ncbi:uncharacterized protein LOC117108482 [Anneissia japonica]|uniref:uncharacterized protein LOC117108482 n=1 Tax=Anneissia japonica TaxID=1529436 RepID=UPI0014259087|nr:uncharacterized protein LOC117108482 [Anneissia japonica]
MPGRINRLFKRKSQGSQKRRSAFASFFNKYFKCCFTVEGSEVDGYLKPSTQHQVWIKVPSHIRVILLRIMYGIAVDLPCAAIAYCDSDPQFDIVIRQYARALILLDGSYFDSSIDVVEDMEPDHLAALNLIRKCFSMDVINYVPALKQPIVVEGSFANCKLKFGDDVLTRSVQKALVENKDHVIDPKLSFASILQWHRAHLESSATKLFQLVNGGFSSTTKTYEPRIMGVKTLKQVKYNIGSLHLATRFLPLIESSQLSAKHSQIKVHRLVSQPLFSTPCMQLGDQNQCRVIQCHRSYSTVKPSNGTIRPFTLNICCDINNTFKVSFKCFQYALDIIFSGEQARSIFAVKTLKTVKYIIGSIHQQTHFLPSIELPTQLTANHSEIKALSLVSQHLFTTPYMQLGDQSQCRDVCHRSYSTVRMKTLKTIKYNIGSLHLVTRFLPSIELPSQPTAKRSKIKVLSLFSQHIFTTPHMQLSDQNQYRDLCHRLYSAVRVKTLKTVKYNIGTIHLKTCFLPSIELPSQLTSKHSEIKALSLVSQPHLVTPYMQLGNQNQCRDIICHRSTTLHPSNGTIRPFTLNICCDINNTFKVSFNCFQYALDIIFDGEQARSFLAVISRMLIYFVGGNFYNEFENRCVVGVERNGTSGTTWHLIPFMKAMCGLFYWVIFRNQQLLFTPAIKAPPQDAEYQTDLRTDTTSYSCTDSTEAQSCQSSVGSSQSRTISTITDIPATAHHSVENTTLPVDYRPELIFIDTDDFEGEDRSLGAPLSGEWQNLLCLSNSYHDLGQGGGKFASASLSPLKAPDDVILPDYLVKLDNILPNELQIILMEDLCPVVLSGKQVQLGKGAYGEVLLKRLDHSDGPLVAIKSCDVTSHGDTSKQIIDEFLVSLEARVLMFLSKESRVFPYVYGICEKDWFEPRKSIVIEYVGHPTRFKSVTLFKAITFKDPNLTISDGLHVARDMAEGVQVMQKHGLIHNDLASRNILLYHDGERWAAKITDFGSVCHASAPFDFFKLNNTSAAQRQQCIAAHREYAPELHFPNSPPTFASDIHSLGNMFWEMGSHLRAVIGVVSVDSTSDANQYWYSLVHDYNGLFKIDSSTGALILEDSTRIDYSTQQSYPIQIRAVDSSNPENTITDDFVLDVSQRTNPSTSVTILSTTATESYPVNEPVLQVGTESGQTIGAVVVYDYGSGDVSLDVQGGNGLYQTRIMYCQPVNGHEQGYKTVCLYDLYVTSDITSQSQGGVITLTSTNSVGQITQHTYNIDVPSSIDETTVPGIPTQAATSIPPMLVFSGDTSPSESLTSNTPIGSITTTDFFNQYIYTIIDDRDGMFQLQGNVLYLSPTAQLDFETASEHEVTIQAVRDGHPTETIQMNFIFQIEDTNEAPTSMHFSNTQIQFGAPAGSSVATISVNDPDNSGGILQDSYCYITGDDSGVFTINEHSLETIKPLMPGQSSYFLQVRCVDSGTPAMYIDSHVIIDVLVDEPMEVDIILTDYRPVQENTGPSVLGDLHAINAATGQIITDVEFNYFMMFMGIEFPLTVKDNQLWTTAPVDYEQFSNFDVSIFAAGTDDYGRELTATRVFRIDVINEWEPPTLIDFATTATHVSTDNTVGDVIGTFGTTGDETTYNDLEYRITGIRSGLGDIDTSLADLATVDGNVLRLGEGIQDITFDGDSEQYVIYITAYSASNPNWSTELVQDIEIFKVNHPPTDIVIDNTMAMENVEIASRIGYLSIIDPDTNDIASSCQVLNKHEVPFDIVNSNELVTSGPLDFETFHLYYIQVQCTDSGGLSFSKTLEISVQNIYEAPSYLSLSNVDVRENAHKGETVGLFYSLVEQGEWVRYSIVQDDVPFEIAGNNTLIITETVNYEQVSQYDITVAAALGDDPSLVTYANFSILIQNVNDPPTAFQLNPSSFSIPESAVDGTVVGSLITIDEDEGQDHNYRIVSDIQLPGAFEIQGNQLLLVDNSLLDFETRQYIEVTIETTDNGEPPQSFQQSVRIRVIDTGEPPTDIIYQTPTLPENSPAGTLVTRLLVDDPDKSEDHICSVIRTDTHSWLFDIVRTSNDDIRLVVAEGADIDYETRPYHRVEVECTDGYNSIRKTLTVFVDNVNEPPEGVDLSGTHSVPIDADAGYVIGQFQVHDPDMDQEHIISVEGQNSNLFKVDGTSLILEQPLSEVMVDGSNPFLQVILKVVDNGINMLSRTQAYTLSVTGLTDFNLEGNEVSELSLPGHPIGRFTSSIGSYGSPQYRLLDDSDGTFTLTENNILILSDVVNYTENAYLFIKGEMQLEDVKETRIFRVSILPEDPCSTGFAQCLPQSNCLRLSKTDFKCICKPGYVSSDSPCFAVNDCATLNGNPCLYNAPCLDGANSFTCLCPVGYQGKLCELPPVDPCQSQPCLNNGMCLYSSDYTQYICECQMGFTGQNCQIGEQPLCEAVHCGKGTCLQQGESFACQCPSSYYGIQCQYAFGVCSEGTCQADEYCIPHIRAANSFICAPQSESVNVNFLNENLGSDATDPFVQSKFNSFVESTEQLPNLYVLFASNTPTNVSIMVFFIINEGVTEVLKNEYVSCILYDECSSSSVMDEFCPDILREFSALCVNPTAVKEADSSNLWIIICALCLGFCLLILLIIITYRRFARRDSVMHTFEPLITKHEGIRYITRMHSIAGSSRNNTLTGNTRLNSDYEYFNDTARRPTRLFHKSQFPGGMANVRSQSDGQLAQHMYDNRHNSQNSL